MGCGATKEAAYLASGLQPLRIHIEENQEYKSNMMFLSDVPLLGQLPMTDHSSLALACQTVNFIPGTEIIRQGEIGDELFVIKSGEAEVSVTTPQNKSKVVAVLQDGDHFGEVALLRDVPRTATIVAKTYLKALKIGRSKFLELGLNDKITFPKRKSVGRGKSYSHIVSKEPTPKTYADREFIARALRNAENLTAMVHMDDARIEALIDVASKDQVAAGETVIEQGDTQAQYFYVVQSGQFDVLQTTMKRWGRSGFTNRSVGTLRKGQSFGELALLHSAPRAATVKATVDSVLWCFDRKHFKAILMNECRNNIHECVAHLDRINLFSTLFRDEKEAFAAALVETHFCGGDVIMRQGDYGNTFYLFYEGELEVSKIGSHVQTVRASGLRDATPFGERLLLVDELCPETMVVTSETAKALAMDRAAFTELLAPLETICSRGPNAVSAAKKARPSTRTRSKEPQPTLKKNLKVIGSLGSGGFGAVDLVEDVMTVPRKTYALKSMNKGFIVHRGMQETVFREKDIMFLADSPFIVRLYETYNEGNFLYFLMQACLGGELHSTYWSKNFYGSTPHCKFYAAGVAMGLAHLHERHVIYRDLKPENLLLDEVGRLLIADMGLAKCVIGKTYTTCGTPEYFAPELISSKGHTTALDWWTLGILIFELMSGDPPFEGDYPVEIYKKVQRGIDAVAFPKKCKGAVENIIRGLLRQKPEERLPVRAGGLANLQQHQWYRHFDWHSFVDGTLPAPYIPKVQGVKDNTNFLQRKADKAPIFTKVDRSGWDNDFATCKH
eukprot:TRINITY_DN5336_c0_g6_i1.p1 TRINITY_DN5336_c0_g6~~TRINITY_DN5336_c0_g6_i1.p1  ORF type:complete len:785 (+),score=123.47 TRINITY_DN5336_c0_g6_i1:60-2414(+)